jgi:hypothetical protein
VRSCPKKTSRQRGRILTVRASRFVVLEKVNHTFSTVGPRGVVLTVPDPNWDNVTNINARMTDGVVGISQYNPASRGSTIASVRSQLNAPKVCP